MEQVLTLPVCLSARIKIICLVVLGTTSFIIPFSFGQPQILVGTIVNAALFASVMFLPTKYFWPIVVLPSLGVLSRGLIFGPFTPFLIYFLPFIWLGNLILIWVFKGVYGKIGMITGILAASLVKFLLLYASANVYFGFHLVPKLFLQTMGIYQLVTAIAGGLLAYFLLFKNCHDRK